MPSRDPLTFPKLGRKLQGLNTLLKDRKSALGLTSGGSSRKHPGARSAASNGLQKPFKPRKDENA